MQSPASSNSSKRSIAQSTGEENIATDPDLSKYGPPPVRQRTTEQSSVGPAPDQSEEASVPATADLNEHYVQVPLQEFSHLTTYPRPPTPPNTACFHSCYYTDTLNFQPTGEYYDLLSKKDQEARVRGKKKPTGSNLRPSIQRNILLEEYLTEIKALDLEHVRLSEEIVSNLSRRSHLIGKIEDLIQIQKQEHIAQQVDQLERDLELGPKTVEELNSLPSVFDHQGKELTICDQVLFRNEYIPERVEKGRITQTFDNNICLVRVYATGKVVAKFGRFLRLFEG